MRPPSMHVLVVGGNRFVGYQLVWRLLASGHRVTVFNRGSRDDGFGDRVERLIGDRTTQDFGRLLAGRRFDAAVDFAAFTGADARSVVSVLGEGQVGHYVFISTGQVYLVRKKCPWPAREVDYEGPLMAAPAPRADRENWIYGVQKRDAEDVLAAATGFPATRLRVPMVNGERDYFRRVEGYLWRMLDGGPVLVPDGGTAPMRHVYGGDVVRAIVGLLGNPATFGQAFNLSQDEAPTLVELLTLLAELLGAPPRLVPIRAPALLAAGLDPVAVSPFSDPWMSQLDASRAKTELGFRPEPLRGYLDKIVTCFLDHPPAVPPEGYARRDAERRLAARLR
jgi:nucleoside-diphosphate-sugar epimerase